jgi:hypothetical protein
LSTSKSRELFDMHCINVHPQYAAVCHLARFVGKANSNTIVHIGVSFSRSISFMWYLRLFVYHLFLRFTSFKFFFDMFSKDDLIIATCALLLSITKNIFFSISSCSTPKLTATMLNLKRVPSTRATDRDEQKNVNVGRKRAHEK